MYQVHHVPLTKALILCSPLTAPMYQVHYAPLTQALILCGVALLMRKAHAGPKYNKDIKEVV